MSMRRWLRGSFISLALLGGCASMRASHIDDARLARVPESERQAIFTAQHNVDVAKANVATTQVARDEARQFRDVAGHELDAAKSRMDAARAGLELGQKSQSQTTTHAARQAEDVALRQLVSARAKKDYADRLVELRQAQIDAAQSTLDLASADVEWNKLVALRASNQAAGLNEAAIVDARTDAQQRLAERRQRVAGLEGETAQLRTAWDTRRREYNTASREGVEPIRAPAPPALLTLPEALRRPGKIGAPPPAGGANEGPSAPQTVPSDVEHR